MMTILLRCGLTALSVFDAERRQLAAEIGVSTVEKVDTVNEAFSVGSCGSNDIGEAGPKIGDNKFGAMQFGGADDDCGMSMVCGTESTTSWTEAFGEYLDLRAETAQRIGVAEAIFVHGFMHNADTVSLREGSNEWRLPVSHEARVDVGFECQRAQHSSSPTERERVALGIDLEVTAGSSVHVQEG
jgi:hypothetical protein